MQIQMTINGVFDMTFFNVNTGEEIREEWIIGGILDNLQQGEYVVGIEKQNVYDINDLENPLYKFSLSATDDTEYDFDEE